MPPGYYIVILCLLSISLVNARKSERENVEWQVSNTMSREAGENHEPVRYPDTIDIDNNQGWSEDKSDYPGSGGSQNDDWGSGFSDDEDDYEDDFSGGAPLPVSPPHKPTKCEKLRDNILRQQLQGALIPRCNPWGEYKAVQCDSHTSECWCVNKWGVEIPYTRGRNIQDSTCTSYDREADYPPITKPSRRPGAGNGVDGEDPFVVDPPKSGKPVDTHEPDNGIIYEEPDTEPGVIIGDAPKVEDDDDLDDSENEPHEHENLSRSIIQTPGLLPGIIGGAVVGLLCAVLLVMFIVYRMRKKDEGSYALEEPKMTSPSRGYTRAPTKEYWA